MLTVALYWEILFVSLLLHHIIQETANTTWNAESNEIVARLQNSSIIQKFTSPTEMWILNERVANALISAGSA